MNSSWEQCCLNNSEVALYEDQLAEDLAAHLNVSSGSLTYVNTTMSFVNGSNITSSAFGIAGGCNQTGEPLTGLSPPPPPSPAVTPCYDLLRAGGEFISGDYETLDIQFVECGSPNCTDYEHLLFTFNTSISQCCSGIDKSNFENQLRSDLAGALAYSLNEVKEGRPLSLAF
ncbi:hypothetical protein CYMTET_18573 [Cymbomonas tetramitiformis]|uniref:Uncharacterized protein n=1 Tax=Cymbomonas tetramitiformis TaxID=36881 RepID=A0AAE0L5S0_9CHLO|nr:hypothetical protein CYMTET_18573 [Cymbomonas tetramitiformis]